MNSFKIEKNQKCTKKYLKNEINNCIINKNNYDNNHSSSFVSCLSTNNSISDSCYSSSAESNYSVHSDSSLYIDSINNMQIVKNNNQNKSIINKNITNKCHSLSL